MSVSHDSITTVGYRPIKYVLCDVPGLDRQGLAYHLLNRSEFAHLRSLMTLLLLPADLSDVDGQRPEFTCAFKRSLSAPIVHRASGSHKWSEEEWKVLLFEPYLIVFLAGPIPFWLQELLDKREVGILTAMDEVMENIGRLPNAHVGLLRGAEDIKQFYGVLQRLVEYRLRANNLSSEEESYLRRLASNDIFLTRPRLSFIPPIPLPQELVWRPAAYILNRISNNVDEPVLQSPDFIRLDNSMTFHMVNVSRAVCGILSVMENGHELPNFLSSHEREMIDNTYAELLVENDNQKKAASFFSLGDALVKSRHLTLSLGVPAGRTDIMKAGIPPSLTVDPEFKKHKNLFLQAMADYIHETKRSFGNPQKQHIYDTAQEAIIGAHRLMCTQLSYLSIDVGAVPLLAPELGGGLFSNVRNFYSTLDARSKKTSKVFRELEIALASALPNDLVEKLDELAGSVIIFSDLPFEWMLLPDGWPICLTKPVCRVPVAATHAWLNLGTLSKEGAEIAIDKPDRVLVLDLIGSSDSIKPSSELFRAVSDGIGQRYTYKSCSTLAEIHELLSSKEFDIVVLDTHGQYLKRKDDLFLFLQDKRVTLRDFLPSSTVPPVWILSACDTAVVGSIAGTLTRELFEHGTLSVVGTLHKIAADAASLFVGKILTEIFSPSISRFNNLLDAFFNAQLTTAMLYDPMFPLMRKCESDPAKKHQLARIFESYLAEMSKPVDPKEFRMKAAVLLDELLQKYQLREMYEQLRNSGLIVPETLLYTIFGLPNAVRLRPKHEWGLAG